MFRFVYSHTDYDAFMRDFAAALEVPYTANRVNLPKHLMSGYYQLIELPNGLQAILTDYTTHTDLIIARQKSAEEIYTLRFNEITVPQEIKVTIDQQEFRETSPQRSAVFLSSSIFDVALYAAPGSRIRGINILITKQWMADYLGIESADDVLSRYIQMRTNSINMAPMDITYRQWMDEVHHADPLQPLWITMVQNRIMLMIERFFADLYERMQHTGTGPGLSSDDILRVIETEALLTKDFTQLAPTINQLARTAAMSASKLKKSFKNVYGLPIYEYYQHSRMHKAREMLLSGDFSVKEVGLQLGYANLSNFTLAFKKEFNLLPSDFVKN